MDAVNLKTEYLINPIGIDIQKPRLMWTCNGGVKQTAYRIVAVSGDETVWDSGKISSSSMAAEYPHKLVSRQRVEWSITLWDENDQESESGFAFFEMGLLNHFDWKAKWITGKYRVNKKKRYPVDCFKKIFKASLIQSARLYITACGLYEVRLNGERVGDFIFAPGSTDYQKRIQYQTYDVTKLLNNGINEMTVELADGWYRGSNGAKGRLNTYGKQTKFIAQLEMTDKEGKVMTVISDDTWSWSSDGVVRFADLKDGEIVDANNTPSYKGRAKTVNFTANLTTSNNVFVKEGEKFSPVELITTPKGKIVLKFPQNLSGYISFRLQAQKGQKIHITLGEMLNKEGELTLENIQCIRKGKRSPLQEIDYVCKDGINFYKPRFFYGGFQYAQIDTEIPFEKDDFTSIAVYSAFEETSSFECSQPLINQLYKNTLWSLKSNSTDFPSDCPTRERMGWTGDSQLFFNTASYMTDYAAFARKHVRDIYDRQWKSGRLPQIAPFANEDWFMWVMNGSVGWACAGVYIPLYFYKKYGDKRILEDNYEGMLKYANFMTKRAGKWGGIYAKPMHLSRKNRKYAVNCGQSYGEWTEPSDVCTFKWYDFAAPHPEESTAYTYFTLKRVLEVAAILEKKQDKQLDRIKKYSEGAKTAYQELVTKQKHTLDTDHQAKLVRPIYMGLLTEEQDIYAKARLIKALDNYDWRLGTGFLSTPLILYVLADIDIEYAYRLLENEKLPGWLAMPKNGATTIWEDWEGNMTKNKGTASLNHYSKGAVCEWLFESMCGIKISGERQFTIKPQVGGSLTYAYATYESIYGKVKSGWKRKNDKTVYSIKIPANTTAKIVLPNGEHLVCAGEYEFIV
ncbi:MAG: family 78 glycoside hydrolase catalytic domain [Acholeplasmataceae bacterium]|nr:family 78 glycoside hydrolase catalytic domain [Acholeplasmataceae bacterium]